MGVEPDHGTRQYHGTAGPSAQCTGWGQHKVCWPDLLHSLAGHCACRHAGDNSIVYGAGRFLLPGPELLTIGCVHTQLVVCLSCDDRRHNSWETCHVHPTCLFRLVSWALFLICQAALCQAFLKTGSGQLAAQSQLRCVMSTRGWLSKQSGPQFRRSSGHCSVCRAARLPDLSLDWGRDWQTMNIFAVCYVH